jgi:3-hydroxybutyryl-CoA dehydrogenase
VGGPSSPRSPRALVIGVVGAGTMGAGIAQLAAATGARTLVHDPDADALERGLAGVRTRLAREVEKGRLAEDEAGTLEAAADLPALADADVVIEAAPESLELKRELFGRVAAVVRDDCVLASNTSSLSVTEIAAGVPGPERVVGMHFFNPAPVMKLVEVVAGERSGAAALETTRELGRAMGRRVIDAADGPGFLVNRCGRPFGLEALRLVQEGLATHEQVDRVCRLGGGFRMGPFELMDLVGVDVGFEVSKSFYAQSFGEPRWRPSMLAARKVASGHHGRKAGRGWYEYPEDGEHRPPDPEPPKPGGEGLVVIAGWTALADELREAAVAAGWRVADPGEAAGEEVPAIVVDCGGLDLGDEDESGPGRAPLQGGPQVLLCDEAPLSELDPEGPAAGFFAAPPLGGLVELTRSPTTSDAAARAAEAFFGSLGRHVEWVGDAPGLVLGRIVCQLVNEACFALGDGVGAAEDIDAGMVLGLNHPRGPLEWGDAIGASSVLGVLAALYDEYREERYRPAPALMRAVRTGTPLRS